MLRLNTFSGLSLHADAERLTGAATQRRPLALLAFLAAANGRGRRRDVVLAHFWPEKEGERARGVLAQTLYALRRDSGCKDLVLGTEELRLNPEVIGSDLAEFGAAIAAGDDRRAAELYTGAFLDGVHLAGAAEFERWASAERQRLEREALGALERLASAAQDAGDDAGAAAWWRRVVAIDPLATRPALRLMETLAASGETAAALQVAQLHESLLAAELELPPDAAIVALAERLRRRAAAAAPLSPSPSPPSPAAPALPAAPTPPPSASLERRPWWQRAPRLAAASGALAALVAIGATALLARRPDGITGHTTAAIGEIREFGSDSAAPAVREMLATSLARIDGLHVVSGARMAEVDAILHARHDGPVTAERVARAAGAAEVLEGTLVREEGSYRLDLRRVDLASGIIRRAYTLRGRDLPELVDEGTARIAADLGRRAPSDGVASIASASRVAYRLYEEGLRAYYDGDMDGARRLFDATLAEDSTFGMAAYQAYRAASSISHRVARPYLRRAMAPAARLPDRDRLFVRAAWMDEVNDARGVAIAETLAIRYPQEPEGHLRLGIQLERAGDFPGALARFARVVALDSASLRTDRPDCQACDALLAMGHTWQEMDSLGAAERVARALLRDRPRSAAAWDLLAVTLIDQGRYDEGAAAWRSLLAIRPDWADPTTATAWRELHAGAPCAAERLLREPTRSDTTAATDEARWWLGLALREQGRPREALAVLGVLRAHAMSGGKAGFGERLHYGQALLEAGLTAQAAAEFRAVARVPREYDTSPQDSARMRSWALVHLADALGARGDTTALRALADTIRVIGAASAFGRDRRLHEHATALLLRARGRPDEAIAAFRRAVYSPTRGFTRSQWEAARLLVAGGRPREAIALAAPALRGAVDASNMYVLRTELHETLADAWLAAGGADSAAAHYAVVAAAWRDAELPYAERGRRARERLAALPGGRAHLARLTGAAGCTAP